MRPWAPASYLQQSDTCDDIGAHMVQKSDNGFRRPQDYGVDQSRASSSTRRSSCEVLKPLLLRQVHCLRAGGMGVCMVAYIRVWLSQNLSAWLYGLLTTSVFVIRPASSY